MKRICEHNAEGSIDRRQIDADRLEQKAQETVSPKHGDPRIGTDECRRQQRQYSKGVEKVRAPNAVARREKSERNTEHHGEEGGQERYEDRVPKCTQIICLREECLPVRERESPGHLIEKTVAKNIEQRIDQKYHDDGKTSEDDDCPHVHPRSAVFRRRSNLGAHRWAPLPIRTPVFGSNSNMEGAGISNDIEAPL